MGRCVGGRMGGCWGGLWKGRAIGFVRSVLEIWEGRGRVVQ